MRGCTGLVIRGRAGAYGRWGVVGVRRIENKPQVALYAGGAVFALWLSSTVIGAINHVPLVRLYPLSLES